MTQFEKAILIGIAISTGVGVIGTTLESIGKALGKPGLVAFGQKLEAFGQDIPKLLGKS